jgi:hypothetical protein
MANKLSSFIKGLPLMVAGTFATMSADAQNAIAKVFKWTNPNTIKVAISADNNTQLGFATVAALDVNGLTYPGSFDPTHHSFVVDNILTNAGNTYDVLTWDVYIWGGIDIVAFKLETDINNRIKFGNYSNANETTADINVNPSGAPEVINENQIVSLTETSPGLFTVVVTNVGDSTDATNYIAENNAAAFCQARAQDGYTSNATMVNWIPSGLNNGLGTGTYTFTLPGWKVTDRLFIDRVNRPLAPITSTGTPLPITIEKFTATKHNGGVDLYFKVNQENVDYYELERSQDGINFETLETIDAIDMDGSAEYAGRDENPYSGRNFYRLKNIDIDGKFSLSTVIAVDNREDFTLTTYPNPATNEIKLDGFEGNANFMIQSLTGAIVLQGQVWEQQPIDISRFPAGMYMVSVTPEDKKYTMQQTKLIKQ